MIFEKFKIFIILKERRAWKIFQVFWCRLYLRTSPYCL